MAGPPEGKVPAKLAGLAEGELPPGLQKLEEEGAEAEAGVGRGKPSRQDMLDKLRGLPGGEEALEEARRRGPQGMIQDNAEFDLSGLDFFKILAWLNPFAVTEAHAQAGSLIWVDKSNDWYSGGSLLRVYGSIAGQGFSTTSPNLFLYPTRSFANSYMQLRLNVPSDGFYIVSVEAVFYGNPTLQHYNPDTGIYEDVDTTIWEDVSGTLYPVMLQLGAGYHFFKITNDNFNSYFYGAGATSWP